MPDDQYSTKPACVECDGRTNGACHLRAERYRAALAFIAFDVDDELQWRATHPAAKSTKPFLASIRDRVRTALTDEEGR